MKYLSIAVVFALLAVGCNKTNTETTQQPVSQTEQNSSSSSSSSDSAKTYKMADVQTANSEAKCYSVINGTVYDLTSWITKHPGGKAAILSICGKDGSSMFTNQHEGEPKPAEMLANYKLGTLQTN